MDERLAGVIIPARDEQTRLPAVLSTVCAVDWLRQIIVVDDHSCDATFEIARNFAEHDKRLTVVRQNGDSGKSHALLSGLTALSDPVQDVIFLDADLINLFSRHIEDLYLPVKNNQYQMSVAVFRSGVPRTDAAQIVTPHLSGQRCMRRSAALSAVKLLKDTGYGIEIGLTMYARRYRWKVKYVPWRGVTHVVKEHKNGLIQGSRARAFMYAQIITTWIKLHNKKNWIASE
jgi:glycosyltransferase involved in cell wall biosynthesis